MSRGYEELRVGTFDREMASSDNETLRPRP